MPDHKKSINDYDIEFLSGIQGNIVQPHKRNHAIHLFISFGHEPEKRQVLSSWLKELAFDKITSAWNEIELDRKGLFCSVLLSKFGYQILEKEMPSDEAFRAGMKGRGALLNDPDSSYWEGGFNNQDIHGLIILANNDPVVLAAQNVLLKEKLFSSGGTVVAEEFGSKLIRSDLEIEHFGFVDGISQPRNKQLQFKDSINQLRIIDPEVLLSEDPYAPNHFGSYLVFRKLEQNVFAWEENVKKLAIEIQTDPFLAGAFAIGRFKDGTAVAEHSEMQTPAVPGNDFNYEADRDGNRCPFHSHMRKMNTRKDGDKHSPLRIARCGMNYGLRPDLHPQGRMFALPSNGVGLLFMCYQNNIEQGFESLQRAANDPDFPFLKSGQDPVISQGESKSVINNWPSGHGNESRVAFAFDRTVTLKGGEYFFAPSISFLRYGISP